MMVCEGDGMLYEEERMVCEGDEMMLEGEGRV